LLQRLAAFVISSELLCQLNKVDVWSVHSATMKKKKHPRHMTSDELMKHLFHPRVVKHIKKVAADAKKKRTKKA
jgi:hypothetical protein